MERDLRIVRGFVILGTVLSIMACLMAMHNMIFKIFLQKKNRQVLIFLWNVLMVLYSLTVMQQFNVKVERHFYKVLFILSGASLALATWLLKKGAYGDSLYWCWIDTKYPRYQFYYFYLILLISWALCVLMSLRVTRLVTGQTRHLVDERSQALTLRIRSQILCYMAVFLLTWFFPLINRTAIAINGERSPLILMVMQSLSVPFQGFVNAVVYKQFPGLSCFRLGLRGNDVRYNFLENSGTYQRYSSHEMHPPPAQLDDVAIFTSTFNMGSCDISILEDIPNWVPLGYDIYAIAVQECLILHELRLAILQYLGGEGLYKMYTQEIGSTNTFLGYNGMIGLIIYARAADVDRGNFALLQSHRGALHDGQNLVVTRLPDKGAVGIPVRYYDRTLAFVGCHFSPDGKGKSQLENRNRQAAGILRDVVLVGYDDGFNLDFSHHHVIILGDLNYRLSGDSKEILSIISAASQLEKRRHFSQGNWRECRHQAVFKEGFEVDHVRRSPLRFEGNEHEVVVCHPACEALMEDEEEKKESENHYFEMLMKMDELTREMAKKKVFHGFTEGKIRFPPTYKYHKGDYGDCGDYCDLETLKKAYVTDFGKGGSDDGLLSKRTSSYTDRILVNSLPDKRKLLHLGAYESIDSIKKSDHHPVALTLILQVNKSYDSQYIQHFDSIQPAPASASDISRLDMTPRPTAEDGGLNPFLEATECMIVKLQDLFVNLKPVASKEADKRGGFLGLPFRSNKKPFTLLSQGPEKGNHARRVDDDGTGTFLAHDADDLEDGEEQRILHSSGDRDGILPRILGALKRGRPRPRPTTIHEVTVLFPLPSEDPLLLRRRIENLSNSLDRAYATSVDEQDGENNGAINNLSTHKWSDVVKSGIILGPRIVKPQFGLHLLIRLSDREGNDIGQGVICLEDSLMRDGLSSSRDFVELKAGGLMTGTLELRVEIERVNEQIVV